MGRKRKTTLNIVAVKCVVKFYRLIHIGIHGNPIQKWKLYFKKTLKK